MDKLNWGMRVCGILLFWAGAGVALPAQTFTTLHSFDGTDGGNPWAPLVQGAGGHLYGTTNAGGANTTACGGLGCGTVFKVSPDGTLTTLYSFCSQSNCTDGAQPEAGLVQGTDGNLYGATEVGGANNTCQDGCGTVFKINPNGKLTTLHSFDGADGEYPARALIQATDGNFYGTTFQGGANCEAPGCGTVFKITPSGTLTTLYNFCSQVIDDMCVDGEEPSATLVQNTDGSLYGTTQNGGANRGGTVFKITLSGTLTTLYSFCSQSNCTDGESPTAGLVQGADGNFYGTTRNGGTHVNCGYPPGTCGTVFKVTPSGILTTLYSFNDSVNGAYPLGALIKATDGNFYGTTSQGGTNGALCNDDGCGTVFKITPSGALTTLHSFDGTDGYESFAALIQDTDGDFYGTAYGGGASNACSGGCGTIFSLSVGLGPFVETNPASGKVGSAVKILGTDLTGATGVTFNGTAATFTVVSRSEITTTVPTGATTGTVQVVTPGGTLSSNVPFTVR
jgi:uncharacterized repeat protein (TIGR03803 family)